MNKTLSTILVVVAVLVLAGGIFFAGSMYAHTNAFGPSTVFGWNNNSYGPGMINNGRGYGMMGGMMNGSRGYGMGPGMMRNNGWTNGTSSNIKPLTVDQARQAAEKYLKSLNVSGLEIGEVMIFDNNAYVVVKETVTGLGAFELLVDPLSGIAYPEHGPNMMWNLKYSGLNHQNMMGGYGGMMNGYSWDNSIPNNVSTKMAVTPEQAIQYAQNYLDQYQPGTKAATDPVQFYGYYTLDFEKDGQVTGMLSVNGYTGQVFLHTWHGTFIKEAE